MGETDVSWKKQERSENHVDTAIISRLDAEGFVDAVNKKIPFK